jgi:uncharacterized protein
MAAPQVQLFSQTPKVRKRRNRRRILVFLAGIVVVLIAAGLGGAAWYYSSQLLDVTHGGPSYSIRVLALSGHRIELSSTDMSVRNGTSGLQWRGGSAIIGPIVSSRQASVVRWITGNTRGLTVGTPVHIDDHVYASPAGLHLGYQTVSVPDPLGPMPAWYLPGRRQIWVVFVHGYNSDRTEALRPLPTLVHLGFPVLDITYRNDVGAPPSPDHLYHLGATEWLDVQAGVRYALAHGARGIVLYGYSMGGGAVESFLHRSLYAGRVRAVVLDSPALDWSSVLDLQAGKRHLPGLLTELAKRVIAFRLGLNSLDSINQVKAAAGLKAPTLLFHGTSDTEVPFSSSAALARARPDIVTFVPVAGAEHTESWNLNPGAYTARLKAFIVRVVG